MIRITKVVAVGALLLAGTLTASAHAVIGDVPCDGKVANVPAITAPATASAQAVIGDVPCDGKAG
jgi:hypothetical protein